MLTVDVERLDLARGERVLDLGCGAGRHAFELMRRGATVVALDRGRDGLDAVRATCGAMRDAGELPSPDVGGPVQGDALTLPFPDGSFDRIVAAEVLEHIPADEAALAELVRVLRPGGRMAVTVPAWLPERVCWTLDSDYHEIPGGHVRIYRKGDLEAKLTAAGLLVGESHHAHALHSPYWWVRCALGVDRADAWPTRRYHDFLVWELTRRPRWTWMLEHALNPVIGKSLVVYADKPAPAAAPTEEAAVAVA
jgi:SAM-dependent methyltransferase